MPVEIRILEKNEYDEWDKLVIESSQGNIFHESLWIKALAENSGVYGYFKDGKLSAGIPFVKSKLKLGIKKLHSPPSTPYFGIVFRENKGKYVTKISDEKAISMAIIKKLKEDFDSITISFSPSVIDMQPFIWEGFSCEVKYTYLLYLYDLNAVWNDMDAKRRNDIVKAEKDSIYIEPSDDFEQTIGLVKKTFDRQGKQANFISSAIIYNNILSNKRRCKSFVAKNKDGKAIGVVYIIWDQKRSYYLFGGYDSEDKHHGASAMAIWEAIKFTKNELRLNCFDFEGSMIPEIETYFRKFGGELTSYYTVNWMKPWIKAISHSKKSVKIAMSCIKSSK